MSFLKKIKRMLGWAWRVRENYDFDGNSLYDVIHYKLQRMYNEFRAESHCLWNSDINNPMMRKLRIALELSKRLSEDNYELKSLKATEAKYGKLITIHTPVFLSKKTGYGSSLSFTYEKCKNDKENEQATKYDLQMSQKYANMKNRDKKYLFKLLETYIGIWWD